MSSSWLAACTAALILAAPAAYADCSVMVNFPTGSAELVGGNATVIDQIAANFPAGPIRIIGYTDLVGTSPSNVALSDRRVASVTARLVAGGVSPDAVVYSDGRGETMPINQTQAADAENRRVMLNVPGCQGAVLAGNAAPAGLLAGASGVGAAVAGGVLAAALIGAVIGGSDGSDTATTTTTGN